MNSKIRTLKNFAHLLLALSANTIYGFPSKKMVVIGVTGTDGKTTTANLIYHILKKNGKKTALISTIGAVIDGKKYETGYHTTTPSYFTIQKYLKMAKDMKCTHVVLEVTSHALDQNRVFGVNFDIGVLTNITREHLNYHKTYEKYVEAKLKLLKNSKISIVNSGGEWLRYVEKAVPSDRIRTYSLDGNNDISQKNLPFKIKTRLFGDFNLENVVAATAVGTELNIPVDDIARAIEDFEPPEGRQQIIENSRIGMIMIDFAHTPGAFEKILPELKKVTEGRLIHIFGSAGQRDKGKRSEMGKISSQYADIIILTSEDPRGEDVSLINEQIQSGISTDFKIVNLEDEKIEEKSIFLIPDRKEAILFALSHATPKDTVVITGKGHERTMNYGKGEVPWSDEEVVKDFLK